MSTWTIVLLVVAVVLIGLLIGLFFVGKKLQKKQDSAEAQMKSSGQTFTILVIDKKRMKLKDANLPKIVVDQTPKYLRATKVPLVKAKIGPQITTLICDPKVYDVIPVKKEIKAVISGIYITEVRGIRGPLESEPSKLKEKEKREKKEMKAKKKNKNK